MSKTKTINPEFYLFAEELLSFVMRHFSDYYSHISQPDIPKYLGSFLPFTNAIKAVTLYHIHSYKTEIMNIFNSLMDHGNLNSHFGEFVKDMVKVFCFREYNEKDFLFFCNVMAMLGILGYNNNFKSCYDHAVFAIVRVLQYLQITKKFPKDGFQKLTKAAMTI